ncbi:hypothetical protein QBC39DRAFT_373401 [Podospora conica]|nr:hypothetical protein QBC39DRAFT_373401 [Schizothecium conicum]
MDTASAFLTYLLKDALPPQALTFLHNNLLSPTSPPQLLLRRATPYITPLLDRLAASLAASPDLVVLAFFLGIVVFTLQVLAYLRRLMMWWTRLAFRLALWSAAVGVGAWVWRRGVEESARDAAAVGVQVAGFAEGVKRVFLAELEKYEAMERGRPGQAGAGAGAGAGRGRGW